MLDYGLFRVTRDADFTVSEDAEDLLVAVQDELRQRRFGDVIRLEVQAGMNPKLREPLVEALGLESLQVYEEQGLLDLADLHVGGRHAGLLGAARPAVDAGDPAAAAPERGRGRGSGDGRDAPGGPAGAPPLRVLRHVGGALRDARRWRTRTCWRSSRRCTGPSDSSPLVPALIRATERGKQAVCMVELKARFDERTNIQWALALEEAGVHVVYGIPGLKTHAKAILIVRREGERIRHYVHIGTGNYNPKTARLYTDLGLFTHGSGDRRGRGGSVQLPDRASRRPQSFRKLLVAPHQHARGPARGDPAHGRRAHAGQARAHPDEDERAGGPGDDPRALRRLARGVKVDLNVRGICCLRPGVPGVSENIRVVSMLGRFLEHSRIYFFERGGETRCYIGSADLMPRNLDHRVEALAPVEDAQLASQVRDMLDRCFADNTHAWGLEADGAWRRRKPANGEKHWAQGELMERAVRQAQATTGRPLN